MAHDSDIYSRAVAWLKIVLPLAALAILSTLFLVSRRVEIGETVPFSRIAESGGAGREMTLGPRYSGVTRDGSAVAMTAERAWPAEGDAGRIVAERLDARFDLPDGVAVDIAAETGSLRSRANELTLDGAVRIDTTDGYLMRTDHLVANLDWTSIVAPGPVLTEGPFGTLESGNMRITRGTDPDDPYRMVFEGGVHLVYEP